MEMLRRYSKLRRVTFLFNSLSECTRKVRMFQHLLKKYENTIYIV